MHLEPFKIADCALIVRMGGVRECMDLRELRDRLAQCPIECIYHHFCETLLRPGFDDPEFRNDFSVWTSRDLHDRRLAERLGVLDPYRFESLDDLRNEVIDIIDDHLSELHIVPTAQRGNEFHLMRAATVVFDTGQVIEDLSHLPSAIANMTKSSLYYHFVEARRRTEGGMDDFTAWLRPHADDTGHLIEALRAVDFYFLTLHEMQGEVVKAVTGAIKEGVKA